jgi:hypothetical protein
MRRENERFYVSAAVLAIHAFSGRVSSAYALKKKCLESENLRALPGSDPL